MEQAVYLVFDIIRLSDKGAVFIASQLIQGHINKQRRTPRSAVGRRFVSIDVTNAERRCVAEPYHKNAAESTKARFRRWPRSKRRDRASYFTVFGVAASDIPPSITPLRP